MSVGELENEVANLKATNNKLIDKIDEQRDTIQNKNVKIDKLTAQLAQANMEIMLLKKDTTARALSESSAKRSR